MNLYESVTCHVYHCFCDSVRLDVVLRAMLCNIHQYSDVIRYRYWYSVVLSIVETILLYTYVSSISITEGFNGRNHFRFLWSNNFNRFLTFLSIFSLMNQFDFAIFFFFLFSDYLSRKDSICC